MYCMYCPNVQDGVTAQQLYCLVICHRRDIACLRSLTADHVPLLRNIRDKATKVRGRCHGHP